MENLIKSLKIKLFLLVLDIFLLHINHKILNQIFNFTIIFILQMHLKHFFINYLVISFYLTVLS